MDKKILLLLTINGFTNRFWEFAKEKKTYKAAYEATEREYFDNFNKRKYSDYNSFRNCRDKRTKNATKLHKK